MHAVVITVDFKPGRESEAIEGLDYVVDLTRKTEGFARGTWMTDGTTGMSYLLFADEQTARACSVGVNPPPEAPVAVRSVAVFEVKRDVVAD